MEALHHLANAIKVMPHIERVNISRLFHNFSRVRHRLLTDNALGPNALQVLKKGLQQKGSFLALDMTRLS